MQDLLQFLEARQVTEDREYANYGAHQYGHNIDIISHDNFDIEEADVVLLGCGEERGRNRKAAYSNGPDVICHELRAMYNWHPSIKIADIGNIIQGASIEDTRAALHVVLHSLQQMGKIVVLIGGTNDLLIQQYEAFKADEKLVNIIAADMLIDLDESEEVNDKSYLMDILTGEPNYVRHYTHLGFQSYYVQPRMLEMLDKLRFDFYRVGRVKQEIEDAEPAFRSANIFSFDINSVRYPDAITNTNGSPNGFSGVEACTLTRYAGMGNNLSSVGIYGYNPNKDQHNMTAKLIAQMIWYFIDGIAIRKNEVSLKEKHEFATFNVSFTSNDTVFYKSKRTGRWWMQLPNNQIIPCSYNDYLQACNDEIPERWFREQERLS